MRLSKDLETIQCSNYSGYIVGQFRVAFLLLENELVPIVIVNSKEVKVVSNKPAALNLTLESEPSLFVYLNDGLAVTAGRLKLFAAS